MRQSATRQGIYGARGCPGFTLPGTRRQPPLTDTPQRPPRKRTSGVQPKLLTINDAAVYLGMSRRTVERIARAGQLPVVRADDGRRRFNVTHLDAYIEAHTEYPEETA